MTHYLARAVRFSQRNRSYVSLDTSDLPGTFHVTVIKRTNYRYIISTCEIERKTAVTSEETFQQTSESRTPDIAWTIPGIAQSRFNINSQDKYRRYSAYRARTPG